MGNKKKKVLRQQTKENVSQKQSGKNSSSKRIVKKFDSKNLLQILFFAIIIIAAGLVLYSVTVGYDLVFCDDNIFVLNFNAFNKDIANIKTAFEKTVGTTYYRPMLNISFIYDTLRGGTDPSAFRLTNLLLHLSASCVVFFFLIKLGYDNIVSFIFAMFIVVHPILTPATAWISGRNDSMITLFILLSFIFFALWYESKGILKFIYAVLHLLFFACSIYTKEIAFVLPLVGISYVYFFKKAKKIFTPKNILMSLGWFAVLLVWYLMRLKAIEGINNPDTVGWEAVVKNAPALPAMIGKIFLPVKMIALPTFESFSIISGIIFILLIATYFILSKKLDKRKAMFGVLWFSLFLLPTFIVRIVYVDDFFDYAEHRAYLPMIGILIILIEFLKSWNVDFKAKKTIAETKIESVTSNISTEPFLKNDDTGSSKKVMNGNNKRTIAIIISAAIILAFGVRSYYYQMHFKDRTAFWSHMIDLYPYKSRGYLDLGKAYFSINDLGTAEKLYLKGAELNPNNKNLYIDLSVIYLRWGKFQKSLEISAKALNIDPDESIANYNHGKALYLLNRISEALPYYEKACRSNSAYPQWFVDLGVTYYVTGQYQKSVDAYDMATRLDPNLALAYSNMGASYAVLGKSNEAEASWQKAISIEPKMYDAYQNLMRYYITIKQYDKAKSYYLKLKENGGEPFQDIKDNFVRMGIKI